MIKSYKGVSPQIDSEAYIHESAVINGDVIIEKGASIWFNTSLRGDTGPIRIGQYSNIQDNSSVHNSKDVPVILGDYVTVGHGAILHSCEIGDNTLIGMGAIVLDHAKIGKNCLIGAGTLVTPGTVIPDGSLVLGSPGKVIKQLTKDRIKANKDNALEYVNLAKEYKNQ